jgi:hypothetical protein
MQVANTRANISRLRLGVILLFLAAGVGSVIIKRLPEFREAFGPALLYVVGGLALVILLAKLFAAGTTEKL